MENQDSQRRVSDLDPLPDNSSEYWRNGEEKPAETFRASWQTKAEARKEALDSMKLHYFVRISGHQAHCTHCDWGFQLDSGDKIIDGHLYNKKNELVI